MTDIVKMSKNGTSFYPQTHKTAIVGFDDGVKSWVDGHSQFVFDSIKNLITVDLPQSTIKLQSPNGTAFLLSVSDDGVLRTTKEGDTNDG